MSSGLVNRASACISVARVRAPTWVYNALASDVSETSWLASEHVNCQKNRHDIWWFQIRIVCRDINLTRWVGSHVDRVTREVLPLHNPGN